MTTISYVLSALVGAVLVTTGLIKFQEGKGALADAIEKFRIFPPRLLLPIAAILPPVELTIGICLLGGVAGPWPLVAGIIISIYSVAVTSVILRKISTACGCFGSRLESSANWVVVGRNIAFLLALTPSLIWPGNAFLEAWVGLALLPLLITIGVARDTLRARSLEQKEV
ncbi:MAG: MauE/DoxX family redox-associated membrane protein [Pseudoclavibacter sp.]